jgi:predicted DNA-binding transcriptional regulator YafY
VRRQVGAIVESTDQLGAAGEAVAPDVLLVVTRACRDSERLRLRYRSAGGHESAVTLDPHRVVSTARRWYLVAWDRRQGEWRTYRIDRMSDVRATGHLVRLVDPPDAVAFVQAAITTSPYQFQARVEVDAPIDVLTPLVPASAAVLTAIDDDRTLLTTGGNDLGIIAYHLLALDRPFVVLGPPELQGELRRVAALADAAGADRAEAAMVRTSPNE